MPDTRKEALVWAALRLSEKETDASVVRDMIYAAINDDGLEVIHAIRIKQVLRKWLDDNEHIVRFHMKDFWPVAFELDSKPPHAKGFELAFKALVEQRILIEGAREGTYTVRRDNLI
ncbi:hypothetical protein [Microvirga sp. KLBC 81]|uniref:hypothetical protein n=1 Tax=Microvirga sp. KLBC 81 TaxID=1862707 RepID=UPI001057AF86|nr:hypothetical protein [Microvirga sp. KLBC 81]